MKNKKRLIGAISITVAIVLAVCAAVGICSFAAERDTTPKVVSKNVSYGSELYIYYAVSASSIPKGETPRLGVYGADGATLKYTVSEYTEETVHGQSCYVFVTKGVAPKEIGKVEYVRAQSSDGKIGELVSYSVEQYLFDRLYSEGYALMDAANGKNYVRRNLYYNLLKYASTAQRLLDSDALATGAVSAIGDVTYFGAVGGEYAGLIREGDAVTVSYSGTAPAGKELDRIELAKFDMYGNILSIREVSIGETVNASGIMCTYPVYKVKTYETLITEGTNVAILTEDNAAISSAEALAEAIGSMVGEGGIVDVNPKTGTGYADVIIVLSNGADAPSSTAALASVESNSPFREARFAAHAYDSRIEISYDVNEYTTIQTLPYAMAEYIDEFFMGERAHFTANQIYTNVTDLVEKQEELDEVLVAGQWANLEAKAVSLYGETNGKAITEALKGYYAMFKDEAVDWYANLYDPGIGGYYVTTSGKMYYGYLPTLESTRQALDFILSSGMIKQLGSNWTKVMPETMKAQITYYVLSLQDANGYFYNPQLTKAQTDAAVSRRGRDLSWGIRILEAVGVSPVYPTPVGGANQTTLGMTPDEWWQTTGIDEAYKPRIPTSLEEYESWLTATVAESVAEAVSKVVMTAADSSTAYLESYSAFAAYLDSKNIDSAPYSVGNELNATYSQIKAYSEALFAQSGACPTGITSSGGINYSGMTLQQMLLAWLEAHINDNGLFGDDGDGVANDYKFANTNGFFKIISIYSNWGIAYPEPVKATEGLLNCLRSDEKSTTNICEVYNAWNALSSLQSNVKSYADQSVKETVVSSITSYIGEYGKYAIDKTTEKQSGYQKDDGTFAHQYIGSATTHQGGIAVGVGADEGNVDAMGFGINGTVDSICGVMGLPTVYKYTESDFMRYLDIILKAEPVTSKTEYVASADTSVTNFESGDLADYAGVTRVTTSSHNNFYGIVAEDENADVVNHVLKITKPQSGSNTNVAIAQYCTATEIGADLAVLEFKFKAEQLSARQELQITLGGSSASPIVVVVYSNGYYNGAPTYVNSTSDGYGYTNGRIGQWMTVRVEYKVTATDESGKVTAIECRTYVNDTLECVITDIRSGKTAPTVSAAQYFSVSVNNSNIGTYYVDDISFIKVNSSN